MKVPSTIYVRSMHENTQLCVHACARCRRTQRRTGSLSSRAPSELLSRCVPLLAAHCIAYPPPSAPFHISHVASYTSPARTKLYAMVACRGRDRSQSVLSRMMNVVLPSTMWPGCVLWRVCPRPAGGLDGEDGGHPVRDGAEPQGSRHRGCSAGAFLRCLQQGTLCLLLHGMGAGQRDTTLDNAHKGQSVV